MTFEPQMIAPPAMGFSRLYEEHMSKQKACRSAQPPPLREGLGSGQHALLHGLLRFQIELGASCTCSNVTWAMTTSS
jgi:hypothetical protein